MLSLVTPLLNCASQPIAVANSLTGSIPSELGQLSAVQELWLGTCFWGIVCQRLFPQAMVSPLTPSLNCVSQPLDSFQYLDRKHSLGARTAVSFAISLFMYVLLWDCLIVFVSTTNAFTGHSFVELCVTTYRSCQFFDRKHSLGARTALSCARALVRYVLLGDCLSAFVSTSNGLTTHAFVELCVTTSRQLPIPWPEAFPRSSDSCQLCNIFGSVRAFGGLFVSVCFHYQWSHHSRFRWIFCHNLLTGNNTLTGSIPSELGQLSALEYLYLCTCFYGNIR